MDDELHYPPGAEPEKPADAPAPKDDKAPEAEPKPEGEEKPTGDEPKPEEKSEDKKPEDPPEQPLKKRSIYDDLKEERGKRKDAEAEVARLKGEAPPEKPADKPADAPAKPATELEAYAQENDLDPANLNRLIEIIAKNLPTASLSEEDKQALGDLKTWRADQAKAVEDQEIVSAAPAVKSLAKELGFEIHDDGELGKIMDEVKRLAHTKEFHDKPVDYIVFAKRAELSKLVSPKKPSFEQGGHAPDAEAPTKADFSSGKITPEQAQKHMEHPKSSYDIRSTNK